MPQETASNKQSEKDETAISGKWFKVEAPEYEAGKRSYFRIGSPHVDYEKSFLSEKGDFAKPGWVEYTDGDRIIETGGNRYSRTVGNTTRQVEGDEIEVKNGWYDVEMSKGFKYESFFGLAAESFLGGKFEANVSAASVSMNLGFEINYGCAARYESITDASVLLTNQLIQEATQSIQFTVDPDDSGFEKFQENWMPKIAAAMAGLVGGVSVAGAFSQAEELKKTAAALSGIFYGVGVLNAASGIWRRVKNKPPDQPKAEILMDKDQIKLKVGDSAIIVRNDGILLKAANIVLCQDPLNEKKASATLDNNGFTVLNALGVGEGGILVNGPIKSYDLVTRKFKCGHIEGTEASAAVPTVKKPDYLKKLRQPPKRKAPQRN
jgi:hypothetical protein